MLKSPGGITVMRTTLQQSKLTSVGGGRVYVFLFSFQLYAKVSFSVPSGSENNFGLSVKLSDTIFQNGRQNLRWLPISNFLSHYAS